MGGTWGRKVFMAFAWMSVCILSLGEPAFAAERFQGNDVSRTLDGNTTIQICDRESDGHRAYTRYDRNFDDRGNLELVDRAAGGTCTNEFGGQQIFKHQTCEVRGGDVGGGDDVCTNFSQHF